MFKSALDASWYPWMNKCPGQVLFKEDGKNSGTKPNHADTLKPLLACIQQHSNGQSKPHDQAQSQWIGDMSSTYCTTANVSVGLTFGVMLKKNVIKYCCAQINNFCDFYFPVGRKCTKLLFRWKARRPRSREAHSAGHRARVWEGRAASSCWQGLLLSPL